MVSNCFPEYGLDMWRETFREELMKVLNLLSTVPARAGAHVAQYSELDIATYQFTMFIGIIHILRRVQNHTAQYYSNNARSSAFILDGVIFK
jgi:hypothetical protein